MGSLGTTLMRGGSRVRKVKRKGEKYNLHTLTPCAHQAGAKDDQGDGNEGARPEQGQDSRQGGKEDALVVYFYHFI